MSPRQTTRHTGITHFFCDESGGADLANETFLVAAVNIAPVDAAHLLKRFRNASKIAGEIKGHRLALPQRSVFFDLLAKQSDVISAVIVCSRRDAKGGWAMGALAEPELYAQLLIEACGTLPTNPAHGYITIVPDGGRYKKAYQGTIRDRLIAAVSDRHPRARVHVGFGFHVLEVNILG